MKINKIIKLKMVFYTNNKLICSMSKSKGFNNNTTLIKVCLKRLSIKQITNRQDCIIVFLE